MNKSTKVTAILLSYNQEKYIKESLTSLLNQNYNNLKIVVSDDKSTDKTYLIINETIKDYKGKNKVIINQNNENLGIGMHFAKLMNEFAEGDLVVAFGGDDISKENRVSRIVEEWKKNSKPSLIAHGLEEINENGLKAQRDRTEQYKNKENFSLTLNQYLTYQAPVPYIGAAIAYRLDTYLYFGNPEASPDYEDHLMIFRSLLTNGIHYFPDPLVKYRRHEESYTCNPKKPKSIIRNKLLYIFKNKITVENINSFRWHQIHIQQWLDYSKAIKSKLLKIDYYAINTIWSEVIRRHEYILKEKTNPNYIKPLKSIIYGAGGAGKRANIRISTGFDVIFFCDSNTSLHGEKINNLSVISPEKMLNNINDIDCILIASMYYADIKRDLIDNLKIPENMICRLPSFTMLE